MVFWCRSFGAECSWSSYPLALGGVSLFALGEFGA